MKVQHLLAAAAAAALLGPAALATPGSGFTPNLISSGNTGALDVKGNKLGHWDIFLMTKDDTNIAVDRLDITAGGYSGWHSHPMPILITVTQGEVVWIDGSNPICAPKTYHAGESFVEPAGRVHMVRNDTGNSAQYVGVRLNPPGATVRVDEAAPQCP